MKEIFKIAALSLSVAAVCGSAMAADQNMQNSQNTRSSATKDNPAVKQDLAGTDSKVAPPLNRISKIIGTDVSDSKGEKIGDIKDIVIDRNTGRIAYAVVSFGGVLGVGDKYFAVPWKSLQPAQKDRYVVSVTEEQLKKAEGFDKDHWPDMASEQWNRNNSKAFNQSPYWEQEASDRADRRRHGTTSASHRSTGSSGNAGKSRASDNRESK